MDWKLGLKRTEGDRYELRIGIDVDLCRDVVREVDRNDGRGVGE